MPRASHLIFVRHAAVQVDPAIDSHRWPITLSGRLAAEHLARRLQPFNASVIFTSEEPKAIATGSALAEVLSLPARPKPGLQEHDRRGTPYFRQTADFESAIATFFAQPNELVFGQETAVQAQRRFIQAVDGLCQTHQQETLIIATHGTVLTLFVCHYNPELAPLPFWQSLQMPCAVVLSLPEKQLLQTIFV